MRNFFLLIRSVQGDDAVTGRSSHSWTDGVGPLPYGESHTLRTSRSEGKGWFQLLPSRAVHLDQWEFTSQKHQRWEIRHQNTAGNHLPFQGQAQEQAEVWGQAPRSELAHD